MSVSHGTVLVQGATCSTGFATITALLNHPHQFQIRVGAHDLAKTGKLDKIRSQVDVVHLDTEYSQTVRAALQGVTKLMLCPPNSEERVAATKLLIQAAVDCGTVSHIVMISILGAEKCAVSFQKQFYSIEQYLERCGVPYTILRCPFLMDDFYFFIPQLLEGHLRVPLGAGCTVMMSAQDVGECAAAVLASQSATHHGKIYSLTGPESLDGNKIACALSAGLGRTISYVPISASDAETKFVSLGFLPYQAAGFIELFQLLALGGGECVSSDSSNLLGRPPVSLAAWSQGHREALSDLAHHTTPTTPVAPTPSFIPTTPQHLINRATNEQGQNTVNQQGQQGAAHPIGEGEAIYFEQPIKLSSAIPVEVSDTHVNPVAHYQRGSFPHLAGHTEQWYARYYPIHEERRRKRENEQHGPAE
jgi:uncharacterized protein YbjT (DUF2867 family)